MKRVNTVHVSVNVILALMIAVRIHAQTQFATSPDNIPIAYEIHGSGSPALVFVHGWSCDRSYWEGQVLPFSRNYTVVAIDLAGHGESGLDRQSWTIEAFGNDVASVVRKLGLQRVVLIGHSMGSNVIAEAARQMRDRLAGLVLVDQYKALGPGLTKEEVAAFETRLRTDFRRAVASFVRSMFLPTSDSALVAWVATDMSSAPPGLALNALASTLHYSRQMPQTLRELKLPVVAINDTRRPTDLASMQSAGVNVLVMPGVGHFMMMEDPERFNLLLNQAIRRFVN